MPSTMFVLSKTKTLVFIHSPDSVNEENNSHNLDRVTQPAMLSGLLTVFVTVDIAT